MQYTIDERGIHYMIEDNEADAQEADILPIPDTEAIDTLKHISAQMNGVPCDCSKCRKATKLWRQVEAIG